MNDRLTSGTMQDLEKKAKNDNYCLNCGSKLRGGYCHICGQQARVSKLTVREFILEYLCNAFMWDPKFLKTLWLLVRKPGVLTKEFLSGKYVSQVHPLKLNMFMLFVFITLFVFSTGVETVNNSVNSITRNEQAHSHAQLSMITDEEEFLDKIEASPRDTVQLQAPLDIAELYPEIITHVNTITDTQGKSLDKWTAVVPRILIEENVISPNSNGYHSFNTKIMEQEILRAVWAQMVEISTRYFPLIVLFTAPFLSFALRLVQHRDNSSSLGHFIFSLHYTAFLELFIIFIYLLYLIVDPSIKALQLILLTSSCIYLTAAFRKVYGVKSWFKAILKAVFANFIYLMIILFTFIILIFIATALVILQL